MLNRETCRTWIKPGNYIIADLDGLVCLPSDMAEDVLAAVETIVRADEKCAEDIKEGRSVEKVFRELRGR